MRLTLGRMSLALVGSLELVIGQGAAIARAKERFAARAEAGEAVGFSEHEVLNDRFYVERRRDGWTEYRLLVVVRAAGDGSVVTIAPAELAVAGEGVLFTCLIMGLILSGSTALVGWFAVTWGLPICLGILALGARRRTLPMQESPHHRALVRAVHEMFEDVRRGGYRSLPAAREPELASGSMAPAPQPSLHVALPPSAAVALAAEQLGSETGSAIVFHEHFDPCCFRVERRRGRGERGGSTRIIVIAHREGSGARIERTAPDDPFVRHTVLASLALLGLLLLSLGTSALHLAAPAALAASWPLRRRQQAGHKRRERDLAEIEAALARTFAGVRRDA